MFKFNSKILLLFLLALFVFGQGNSLLHSFSHHSIFNQDSSKVDLNNGLSGEFEKDNKKSDESEDCKLYHFGGFQNYNFLSEKISFIFSSFILLFALRFFNSVKLSYLLNSFSPRAPPAIS